MCILNLIPEQTSFIVWRKCNGITLWYQAVREEKLLLDCWDLKTHDLHSSKRSATNYQSIHSKSQETWIFTVIAVKTSNFEFKKRLVRNNNVISPEHLKWLCSEQVQYTSITAFWDLTRCSPVETRRPSLEYSKGLKNHKSHNLKSNSGILHNNLVQRNSVINSWIF
jgi:hypothetical protein